MIRRGLDVSGTHIPGTKNVPAAELIDENGLLEDNDEIRRRKSIPLQCPHDSISGLAKMIIVAGLESVGFDESKPTVTLCNTGMQASLVSFALESLSTPISSRLYGVRKATLILAPSLLGFRAVSRRWNCATRRGYLAERNT